MIVSLVNVNNVDVSTYGPLTSEGFEVNLTAEDIVPKPIPQGTDKENEYCKKLYDILSGKKITNRNLSIYFKWAPSSPSVGVSLQGKLLDTLQEVCGENIKLRVNGEILYKRVMDNGQILPPAFHTSSPTMTFSLLYDASSQKQVSFCRHSALVLNAFREYQRLSLGQMGTITITVSLLDDDEYLHKEGGDFENLKGMCKWIQQKNIRSDVSILPANSADALLANKCFLAAHSPVLDALFEGSFKEAMTNTIKMEYSVECVKALLDYVYTLDFPRALQSSNLAVELLQAANYYQIKKLEDKLEKMFLLRANSWFDMSAAIGLFQTANMIEICSSSELKTKAVQVILSKDNHRMDTSFQKLFKEDWNTAMEMCVMLINIKKVV